VSIYFVAEGRTDNAPTVRASLSPIDASDLDRIRIALGDFMISLSKDAAEELADALMSALAVLEDLQAKRATDGGELA